MTTTRRRRPVVSALLAVAVLVAAGACVRDERRLSVGGPAITASDLPPCPLAALAKAKGPVTVELWHAINAEAKTNLEELARDFNASQTKVKVQVRSQGTQYKQVLQAYVQAIGGGGLPGMLHTDSKDLQLLIDTKTLLPAQSCFEAQDVQPDLLPAVRSAFTVDDVYWPAYPTVSDQVVYYNQNMFRQAGLDPDEPPLTLAEMERTARALKRSGVAEPLALLLDAGFVTSWVAGAGEELVNNRDGRAGLATKGNFDNPRTREVFAWVKRMVDSGLAKPYSTGGIDQFLAVATKRSAMVIETSTASTTIAKFLGGGQVDTGGLEVPEEDIDLDSIAPAAGPMPGLEEPSQVQVGGGAFFIPRTNAPEVQAAAWMFARYMQQPQAQIRWHTKGSYLPTSQAALDSRELKAFWASGLAGALLTVGTAQLTELDPDRPGPIVGPRNPYYTAIESALSRVARGGSIDSAVTKASDEIDGILEQYAEDNSG